MSDLLIKHVGGRAQGYLEQLGAVGAAAPPGWEAALERAATAAKNRNVKKMNECIAELRSVTHEASLQRVRSWGR
jgi:hypothetical protein